MSTENPLDSLRSAILFDSKDFSLSKRDAWIYGIVIGWGSGLDEVASKHRWNKEEIERLQRLHQAFSQLNQK